MATQDKFENARSAGRRSLDEAEGKEVLASFGLKVPSSVVVSGPDDPRLDSKELSGAFAVKVMSPEILHKSDAGGVVLNALGAQGVRAAIESIAAKPAVKAARVHGYLVERMCPRGQEFVVGGVRDPQFGPMVMVGIGGIFVEIFQDVAFRLCPITRADAVSMLHELRGAKLLEGARGRAPVDTEGIVEVIMKVGGEGGLLMQFGDYIEELDLNPVIVGAGGAVVADARFILREVGPAAESPKPAPADAREMLPVAERFAPLFAPRSIAVLGASTTATTMANTFIKRMKDFGYAGNVYPIHPKATEVEGLRAYPSLAGAPEVIDYAYIAIGANAIPGLLRNAEGRVRFAQVISSGFGEVEEGRARQDELVKSARAGGCRVLGPNCLGIYSPRGKVTFPSSAPSELGTVGIVSQSGGLGTDIIKRGQWRGLRFSGLVTLGNSADLAPVDLLEFYFADPETSVIGLYIEDVKDGRKFFELLRSPIATKPVVILRGGRSQLGRTAAASHTGAMAGDGRAWEALAKQAGCVLVETVDLFINALLAFQFLAPRANRVTTKVVLFGNGGGTSVLATDSFADCGLQVAPFDDSTLARLSEMDLPPGTSVANPIDAPVATLQEQEGRVANRIFDIVYQSAAPDAMVMHINLAAFAGRGGGDPVDNLIAAAVNVQKAWPGQSHFVIVLRADGSPELEAKRRHYREIALAARIPVYDELVDAAHALKSVRWAEQHRTRSLQHPEPQARGTVAAEASA